MPGGHVLQKPALGVGQTGNKLHAKKSYESHTWALKLLWIPHMSLEMGQNLWYDLSKGIRTWNVVCAIVKLQILDHNSGVWWIVFLHEAIERKRKYYNRYEIAYPDKYSPHATAEKTP